MPTTQVILTAKIQNLGAEADIVKVKAGYARNFLIPKGRALELTPAALRRVNILKGKRAEREAQELNDAQEIARRINKLKLDLEIETGETGKAFGSITATDLAEKLRAGLGGNLELDRHAIQLERPIKTTGKHEIPVKLHADVVATLEVNVTAKGAPPETEGGAKDAEGEKQPGSYKAKAKARHKAKPAEKAAETPTD